MDAAKKVIFLIALTFREGGYGRAIREKGTFFKTAKLPNAIKLENGGLRP